jgi:hypothetical protein
MAHRHDDVRRVAERHLVHQVPDLAEDVGVRAQEHAQQIESAYDTDQLTACTGNRQARHLVRGHHACRGRDGGVRADRDGHGHQLAGGERRSLGPASLCGQQVGFGHHADHLPAIS